MDSGPSVSLTPALLPSSGVRRKVLLSTVASLVSEAGFDSADRAALESLTEMAQSFIVEAGRSSRSFCELAGRVRPIISDVIVALLEMGRGITPTDPVDHSPNLDLYYNRPGRPIVPPPGPAAPPKIPSTLSAGEKHSHPPHIPDYLPPFPDPHAYIRTPTHKQPVTEYEAIREKAAAQKRDVERALTRFMAKTGVTQSLFSPDDVNLFPLVACKPSTTSYIHALLPKDQVFDEEEEPAPSPVKRKKDQQANADKQPGSPSGSTTGAEDGAEGADSSLNDSQERAVPPTTPTNTSTNEAPQHDPDFIDNPYLRPVKMPRRKKKI